IAHEVNNPLTIIKGTAELMAHRLRSGLIEHSEAQKLTKRIIETVNRIALIVDGLHKFSRSEPATEGVTIEVNHVITDVLNLCHESLKAKFIDLQLQIPEEPLVIACQPIQISQILLNLINNASDAIAFYEDK